MEFTIAEWLCVALPAVWLILQESYAHKAQAGRVTPGNLGTDSMESVPGLLSGNGHRSGLLSQHYSARL